MGGLDLEISFIFIHRSVFLKFGTMFLAVIVKWFNWLEIKILGRVPFIFWVRALKILIIFIYCAIFIQFWTLFPDSITWLFNCVKTKISERGSFFSLWGKGAQSQNHHYFYLPLDLSIIHSNVCFLLLLQDHSISQSQNSQYFFLPEDFYKIWNIVFWQYYKVIESG